MMTRRLSTIQLDCAGRRSESPSDAPVSEKREAADTARKFARRQRRSICTVHHLRLDRSASEVPLGEYCRVIDPTKSEFLELHHARPEIELLFNNMKGTAQERRRRCRHCVYALNWLDRINQMLRRNQMALMNFEKRNGLSPG